jgi:formylglycine-generating enzyme required for sulfatase activity
MEIYLQQDDARSGPYSMEQVRIWYRDGLLPADSKAWFDGCADWLPVEEIPGIDEGSSVHMVDISTVPPFEAYQGEEPYVFASYAHKDAALVYPELTQLNDAGFNIWYDEGVDASSEWPEEIAKAVIGCAVFIVFVSPRATQSVNCRNEINLALNKSKPFLAIYLEETELPPGLELRMGDLQAILRYKLPVDRYQKKTHDSLNLLLGKKPAQSRTRPPIAQQAEAVHEPETISAPVVEPSPTDQVDVGKASPNTRRKSLIVALTSVFLIACGTLGFVFLGDEGKGEQETPTPDSISVRIFTPGESWTVPTGSIEMLWCEPGTFTMGSPTSETGRMSDETEHNVTLTKGFYLGKYEVTQAQYEAVMTGNPNGLNAKPSEWPNNPNRPVEKVSWDDAQVFLTRLNAQQAANLPAGWSYVLPTESQWEYACRAGTTTASSWGATIASPNANYNWDGAYNTGSDFKQTRDVGQYAPNPWGFSTCTGTFGSGPPIVISRLIPPATR